MPTYTATQLQESYPRCPHCACTDLADLVREEILSFELFNELDDLKLQEVLVELMREGAPGLFLQQAPLSVRNHVRENLSSYNRDRLDAKDAGGVADIAPAYLPLIEAAGPFETAHDRLCAFDVGGALRSRLDGLWQIASGLKGRTALTLDPTERHGFEYQTWLGFSIFADGVRGEIGRGGSYTIVHEDGSEEAATGFSLYVDAIVAAGLADVDRRRLFVPVDTDPAHAAAMRAQGWVTVAALEAGDTPEAQLCTHILVEGTARPL